MQSRAQAGDEANASFGPGDPTQQNSKPGIEPAAPGQRVLGEDRRVPNADKHTDRAPLAERIRGRKGG